MFWFALSHVHSFFELTELKHVTVQSFVFELKKLQTEALEDCLNSLNVFSSQAITDPDHCPLSSSTTRSLQSTMATVTAATAGRTEQHSAVTDRGLTDFPLGRFNQLVANTLRVPALGYESVSATEMLAPTLPEFEAAEINDLLLVTQAVTAVRTHCETLKSTALSQDWLPSTAVPGSMTDGLYGIRYAIPSPDSPCNCFSLAALHSRRCQNWHALKNAETLFPNCKMPHSSYTLAEFNCYGKCGSETVEILTGLALKGDVVTTGQTAQSMCFATSLSTAKKILDTGLIPVELFTNSQVNNWFCPRSALLRSLQIYCRSHWHTGCSGTDGTDHLQSWTGEVPYLVHCSWTEEQLDWHWRKNWSVHWLQQTVLGPLLDYWITPTGCSVEHCGVPHWIWDPTALHCQGTDGATADGTELQQDLWFALQRTGWPLHPHCESAGTDAWRCEHWMCLAALVHWWGTAKENWKQTGNCSWRNWHCQGRCEDHWTACWIWGSDCDYHWSLRLSIPTWSLRQLFLNTAMLTDALKSWKQVHWWASSATHLHTAPRLIDTVQLFTDCVFHWLASIVDHCMHVQVCDTDSLNQCQGEVLRYMHCTHTTAHSNDTVKHTHCLAQGSSRA